MPRKCTICEHENRHEIDKALINGASFRDLACQYDIGRESVRRHKEKHLPALLVLARDAETVLSADNLMDQMKRLQERTLKILDAAEKEEDLRLALAAIREARGNLQLMGKVIESQDYEERIAALEEVTIGNAKMKFTEAVKRIQEGGMS